MNIKNMEAAGGSRKQSILLSGEAFNRLTQKLLDTHVDYDCIEGIVYFGATDKAVIRALSEYFECTVTSVHCNICCDNLDEYVEVWICYREDA